MVFGYCNKIAFIDLTTKEIKIEQRGEGFYKKVLGGEGLGAWLLNELIPVGADPLGPDNGLCIAAGFLSGSSSPASPRIMVMTKSPITGGFGDSNAGGRFGPELKKCGFDALYIKGIAEKPTGIVITDDSIQLCSAEKYWGMNVVETREAVSKDYDCRDDNVATIGSAGESKSYIASIMFGDRTAARSGVGAVMGSKNLKFISAKGTKNVDVKNKEALNLCNKKFRDYLMSTDYFVIDVMRKYGSCGFMSIGIKLGIGPIKNWTMSGEKSYPHHEKIDGENVIKYRTKRSGCLTCPIACGGLVKVEEGPFELENVRLPEYETIQAFGPFMLCEDIEACFKAQELCDNAGIDTISTGHVVAFAIECFENNVINEKDTGGLVLKWSDPESMIALTDMICKREGFGAVLADGVKIAVEKIGVASEPYGIHIGGQEPAFHDFRYEAPSRGLTYIADPTPARHERCSGGQLLQLKKPLGKEPEFQPEDIDDDDYDALGRLYAKGATYYSAFSSCGFCAYTLGAASELDVIGTIRAFTGWDDFSAQDFLDVGERTFVLRQMFSLREGFKYENVKFPKRLTEPAQFEGALAGKMSNIRWYDLRESYFKAYDFEPKTGAPSIEKMEHLGIKQFYKEIR